MKQIVCFSLLLALPLVYVEAQWGTWSDWGDCLGLPCKGGGRFRSRNCTGTCVGNSTDNEECAVPCDQPVDWSPYFYTACMSAEPECVLGSRTLTRFCSINGTDVAAATELCPGGVNSSQETQICGNGLCASFFPTIFPEPCSELCGNGYRLGTRLCSTTAADMSPSCRTVLEYCNLQSCSHTTFPHWGDWRNFGDCTQACSPGVIFRSRDCLDDIGSIVNSSLCTGDSVEVLPCNEGYCETYSEGVKTCLNGEYIQITRVCRDDSPSFTPLDCIRTITNEACEEQGPTPVVLNDPDIDLLLLLDVSVTVDDCNSLLFATPITNTSDGYNTTYIPNYLQQTQVAASFVRSWNEVSPSRTRIAVSQMGSQLRSSTCGQSENTDYMPTIFLDSTTDIESTILNSPYLCGSTSYPGSAFCGSRAIFNTSRGDRINQNYLIVFASEVSTFNPELILQVLNQDLHPLNPENSAGNVTMFWISVVNPATRADIWEQEQTWLRRFACGTDATNTDPCPYFLGSTWNDFDVIIGHFRAQVSIDLGI
ncbi:coadhesin-like [Clavelina lepadiformis]|uniref:coadhesin-like n=1 Tax=Clavelina lepadiformis TaxID=159417 RepID=UPI00404161B9